MLVQWTSGRVRLSRQPYTIEYTDISHAALCVGRLPGPGGVSRLPGPGGGRGLNEKRLDLTSS